MPDDQRDARDRSEGRFFSEQQVPLERIIHIAEFRVALRAFLRRSERIARGWGLTPQRYLLLLAIKGAPDGSQRLSFTELAQRLQLSRNTVTELCARAEESGLIRREPAEHDARVVYLRLTDEGNRRLCGAVIDNEAERSDLVHAFGELVESFRVATERRR
ncbi:MAG: MarR family transcriptional regulator [Actinomycetota bacterium]|nr:MarR family transcriptional regulator [Actinomycetota bacterium]